MSELTVGTISGLAANNYVVDVADGSLLTQPGMVLQAQYVNSVYGTSTWTTSDTTTLYEITGTSVSITPKSTSSKIIILATISCYNDTATRGSIVQLRKDGASLTAGYFDSSDANDRGTMSFSWVDEPASTDTISYSIYGRVGGSGVSTFRDWNVTVMEIAG